MHNSEIHTNTLNAALELYLQQKEQFLDTFIDSGSDQELFVASYIHGHFSVIAAQSMAMTEHFENIEQAKASVEHAMYHSINQAIDNKELESSDVAHVRALLEQVFKN